MKDQRDQIVKTLRHEMAEVLREVAKKEPYIATKQALHRVAEVFEKRADSPHHR